MTNEITIVASENGYYYFVIAKGIATNGEPYTLPLVRFTSFEGMAEYLRDELPKLKEEA